MQACRERGKAELSRAIATLPAATRYTGVRRSNAGLLPLDSASLLVTSAPTRGEMARVRDRADRGMTARPAVSRPRGLGGPFVDRRRLLLRDASGQGSADVGAEGPVFQGQRGQVAIRVVLLVHHPAERRQRWEPKPRSIGRGQGRDPQVSGLNDGQ